MEEQLKGLKELIDGGIAMNNTKVRITFNGRAVDVDEETMNKIIHSWVMSDDYMECSEDEEHDTDNLMDLIQEEVNND